MQPEPKSIFTAQQNGRLPPLQDRPIRQLARRPSAPAAFLDLQSRGINPKNAATHAAREVPWASSEKEDKATAATNKTDDLSEPQDRPVSSTQHRHSWSLPPISGSAHSSKRPRDILNLLFSTPEPPLKKPRPKIGFQHTPNSDCLPRRAYADSGLLSPLFFSNSPKARPPLPPPFSSSEAADIMLNKTREEASNVTTLKLARGTVSSSSPGTRTASTPGSWIGRESMPMSPDSRNQPGLQLLGGVGIIELLEQDERPTFIVDIANGANFSPGPLQVVFANASLRAYGTLMDLVMGKTDLSSPNVINHQYPEFKAWVLSFVKNHESMDVCMPSFHYGGITWTCSTLRKRLRLISGNSSVLSNVMETSPAIATSSSVLTERLRGPPDTMSNLTSSGLRELQEPTDYFGSAKYSRHRSSSPAGINAARSDISTCKPTPAGGPIIGTSISETVSSLGSDPSLANQAILAAQSGGFREQSNSFDWTRLPLSPLLPRHVQFARSIDWASTALGPIETWSFDLRAMCNLILASPHPAAMYWGPEYIAIYNEAYVVLAGMKHPALMGQSYKVAWAEIWDEIEEVFSSASQSGQATMKDDDCLFIERNGFLEESYFSWSIIPLVGEDGSVVGLYNPCFEKTRRKIAERRMLTLREVGEKTATAREVKDFWAQVIEGLEYNDYDVPFFFLYSVSEENDSDMSSMNSGSLGQAPQCVLEGSLGVPAGHPAAQSPLDLRTSTEGFAPYLRESIKTDRPVLLTVEDGTLSSELIAGLEWRGFGDACRSAVVCPIHPTTGENVLGFLVLGINPRRPYDDDYSLFVQLLCRQLATSMASVVLFEQEIRRGQRAARLAALDRIELSKQLDLRTQEAVESETKFTRMAEFAPVGMFIANAEGRITYSNETWWEITRHQKAEDSANTWMDSIKDEDRPGVEALWERLLVEKTAVTHEFRFKAPWRDKNGVQTDTWALMSAYPEREDGKLKSVFGSITNISQQKLAESFQKRRMEEAVELKRQQENFIDITSHEMRNPLSAILQCADEITTTLTQYRSSEAYHTLKNMALRTPSAGSSVTELGSAIKKLDDLLENGVDAAQTIALCAQHQKRIVDDVLTLSKLDSALLLVTPVDVQPVTVVQRALKMFEGELETHDIKLEFKIQPAYKELNVNWVKLDPSRLLQVLINLTTNAIKFTHQQSKRIITVSIGASKEQPTTSRGSGTSVMYFPSQSETKETMTGEDWGDGEELFLNFAVQDTGRGLDETEKKMLFQRFSQGSPRTHVTYGGSGLGLFISRELTELQGGAIGVASEPGVGSTFAFYIKARRAAHGHNPEFAIAGPEMLQRTMSGRMTYKTVPLAPGEPALAPPGSSETPAPLDPRDLKVLIVEDNLVNQKVLRKQLLNLGCTVHVANHGGEALDIFQKSQFWKGNETSGLELSVVLMDLEMPVMDGLSCAKRVRELEREGTIVKHIPIIAVTANARMEQIQTAITAGMDSVVTKPFRLNELLPKVAALVQREEGPVAPQASSGD